MAIALALTLGCFVATASAEQWGDVLQQDKSQQNSADEAQLRGDFKAGSECATQPRARFMPLAALCGRHFSADFIICMYKF
jgi:hypothetical protein